MTIDKTQLIFGAVILGSILLVAASVRYLLRRSGYLQRVSPNVPIVMISIGALIFAVLAVIGVFEGEQDSGSAVFAAFFGAIAVVMMRRKRAKRSDAGPEMREDRE